MLIAKMPRLLSAALLGGILLAVGFWVTRMQLNTEASIHELAAPVAPQDAVTQAAVTMPAIDESVWRGYSDGREIGPDFKVYY